MKLAVVLACDNVGCVGVEALVRAGWKVAAEKPQDASRASCFGGRIDVGLLSA